MAPGSRFLRPGRRWFLLIPTSCHCADGCVTCSPWLTWWKRWRIVLGSREETESTLQALQALLEWQDRTERWMRFPEADREALVSELARLMVRVATEESNDERRRQDPPQTS